jgi:lipoprotein-anchoring transpeptidase ErfK/SrfK
MATNTCPIGTIPYIILDGDTISDIAIRYNTTVKAILSVNPSINPSELSVGQQICISQKQPQTSSCPFSNSYVIRKNDTLYLIAKAFNIPITRLIQANPTLNPSFLEINSVICIPFAPSRLSIVVKIEPKILDVYDSGSFLKSYPIAVGRPETPTPEGNFSVVNKQLNPGGPFGTRWLGLSEPHYGIHGTNMPRSIGFSASNGCIRMYNSNVEDLFNIVTVPTEVIIF